MKLQGVTLALAILALASADAAVAQVHISVGVSPFAFGGYAPAVVYQPQVTYAPPPVVYLGGGSWGGHEHRRGHQGRSRHR